MPNGALTAFFLKRHELPLLVVSEVRGCFVQISEHEEVKAVYAQTGPPLFKPVTCV